MRCLQHIGFHLLGAPTVSSYVMKFVPTVAEISGTRLRAPTVREGFPP